MKNLFGYLQTDLPSHLPTVDCQEVGEIPDHGVRGWGYDK